MKKLLFILIFVLFLTLVSALPEQAINEKNIGKLQIRTMMIDVDFKTDILSYQPKTDLERAFTSGFSSVSLDSKTFPELNKPATITFKNICFTGNVIAEHDGEWEPSVEVRLTGLCEYQIDVTHWSTWTLTETAFTAGTHNQTTVRSGNLEKTGDAVRIFLMNKNESTIYDNSTNNQGANTTAPSPSTDCHFGSSCLDWDGVDDEVKVKNNQVINTSEQSILVLSAWAKVNNLTDLTEDWIIRGETSDSMTFGMTTYNNKLYCYSRNETGTLFSSNQSLTDNATDTWYQYGCVINYDEDLVYFYQNGVQLVGTSALEGNRFIGNVDEIIFGSNDGAVFSDIGIQCSHMFFGTNFTGTEMLVLNNSATCDTETYSPNAIWKFDEYLKQQKDEAKVFDSSGQNNLSQDGSEPEQESGNCKYGDSCFRFGGETDTHNLDGDDKTEGGYPTVCAWVRNDEKTASETYKIYDDLYTAGAGYNGTTLETYVLGSGTRAILFGIGNGTAGISQNVFLNPYGLDYDNNEWHHICGNYNGSHINYYLDGNFIESDTAVYGEIGTSSYVPRIGDRKGSTFLPMNGSIQCTQYWNYPVKDLYDDINNSNKCYENWFEPIDSTGKNSGTCTQESTCPKRDNECKYSTSCSKFSKAEYTSITDNSNLDLTDEITISAWIKCNKTSDDYIINKGTDATVSYAIQIGGDCKHLFLYTRNTTTITYAVKYNVLQNYIDQWVHIAATYSKDMDNGTIKLYVKGTEVSSYDVRINNTEGIETNNNNLVFNGAIVPYRADNITMECIEIWNKSLLSFQIANINNSATCGGADVEESKVIGRWKLNEFPAHTWKLEPNPGDMGAFYTTDGKYNGGFEFDENNDDYINISSESTIDNTYDGGGTISFWIYPKSTDTIQIFSKSKNYAYLGAVGSQQRLYFGQNFNSTNGEWYGNIPSTYINTNTWSHVAIKYNSDSPDNNPTFYINGTEFTLGSGVAESNTPTDTRVSDASSDFYIGNRGLLDRSFIGLIDEVKIYNRTLSTAEIQEIYVNNTHYKYTNGNYYQTYNATDYDTQIEANVWNSLTINGSSDYTTVMYRAGDCPSPSGSWTMATQLGNLFTFGAGIQGDCLDVDVLLAGSVDVTDSMDNWTITSVKYLRPSATIEDITGGDNTTVDINGSSVWLLNDTDTGTAIFTWYVNNINVWNETKSGLTNGTNSTSTLNNANFSKGDLVHFRIIPYNSIVTGNTNHSDNITIGNADFSYTFSPLNNVTYQLKKPLKQKFKVTITDVDNDVVTLWTVNSNLVQTGDSSYTIQSISYDDYELLDLMSNMSDGEFTYTVTWNLEILPADLNIIGSIAITLFILFVTGGLFIFPLVKTFSKNEFVNLILKRCCWLIGIYLMVLNSSIMATIAQASGLDLTEEMFRYMLIFGWAGYCMMAFTVFKTLLDVLKLWRIKKENDRVGNY